MSDEILEVRYDDIAGIEKLTSADFGPWGPELEVTQPMIQTFADLTGDHQWIHVDVERARKESPYGGPIAHGFLTLSLMPRLRSQPTWRIVGYGSAANYGADGLRFIAPVPVGSRIHARSRLARVEQRPSGTLVLSVTEVRVVGADKPALTWEGLILYRAPRA